MMVNLLVLKMDSFAADSFHALEKENTGKTAAPNLVLDIEFVVFNANSSETFGQIGIAKVLPLEFGLEHPLNPALPVPALFRGHPESPDSITKGIINDAFLVDNSKLGTIYDAKSIELRAYGPTLPLIHSRPDAIASVCRAHVG